VIIENCAQGSIEWYQLHAGVPGASSFDRIITTKGELSKQRGDYLYELAGEKILGSTEEGYLSFSMQKGLEREAEARSLFEFVTGKEVKQVGFVFKNENRTVGCSPDGLLENAGLEIKCPMLKTHTKYLLEGKLPTDYFTQVQGSMWVCDYAMWFFMSYYPGMPHLILEVKRDNDFIGKLEISMANFIRDLKKMHQELLDRINA
jgi:hypothetical protein